MKHETSHLFSKTSKIAKTYILLPGKLHTTAIKSEEETIQGQHSLIVIKVRLLHF